MYLDFIGRIGALPRRAKRAIIFAVDLALVPLALWLAYALRFGTFHPFALVEGEEILFPLLLLLAVPLIHLLGLARVKIHAFEITAAGRLMIFTLALALAAMAASHALQLPTPRSVPGIFVSVHFLLALSVRLLARELLARLPERARQPVAIYGAGAAGIQLAAALGQSAEVRPVAFVDDNPALWGMMIAGLPVHPPARLEHLVRQKRIEQVLVAMPSAPEARLETLLHGLSSLPVRVQILPSYVELMRGREGGPRAVDAVDLLAPDALLGRKAVDLDTPAIAKAYAGRTVMVTGAGGSIGSELCRQLLDCRPARIVLFEQGEFALYTIDRDLRALAEGRGVEIVSRLGSVTNPPRVAAVMAAEGVEIVLHAAAYKHVPLVEENELEGARNNVIGTRVVAEAALAAGVERFILVSTDKAVRPTSVMGATKRMAELVIQDLQTRSPKTRFAMVRFGNVLGSSGSVLPLFQSQIARGGPVTVTHPEMTRFFMTIPEAARLVLLAGAYAEGGDVFVLDMGRPQRILDIARQMIELSGARVKDPVTGEGDIEIRITGPRRGEKLHEELLTAGADLTATPHEKILRAREARLSQIEVAAMLREIEAAIATADASRLRAAIARWITERQAPPARERR